MMKIDISTVPFGREALRAIQSAVADLDPKMYRLSTCEDPDSPDHGIIIELRSEVDPENTALLRVWLFEGADSADVVLGRDMSFELPFERGWRPTGLHSFGEEMTALARAVIDGGIQETIWYVGDTIAGSKGRVRIAGREHKPRAWHFVELPDVPFVRKEFHYAPYAPPR